MHNGGQELTTWGKNQPHTKRQAASLTGPVPCSQGKLRLEGRDGNAQGGRRHVHTWDMKLRTRGREALNARDKGSAQGAKALRDA